MPSFDFQCRLVRTNEASLYPTLPAVAEFQDHKICEK